MPWWSWVWLCVCVCVSVTLQYCIKTAKRTIMQIMPHNITGNLVFWHQSSRRNLNGITLYRGECLWRGLKLPTFDEKRYNSKTVGLIPPKPPKFLHFSSPFISLYWVNVEISNLLHRFRGVYRRKSGCNLHPIWLRGENSHVALSQHLLSMHRSVPHHTTHTTTRCVTAIHGAVI